MKTITSIVFIISFSLLSFSQPNRDKIKSLKIAFITEKLDLSKKEAQQFWPVYNAFEQENFNLKKQAFEDRKNINIETLKEEEAVILLKKMRALDTKRKVLKENYLDDLSKIISAKKIMLLEKAEDDFKHKMFEEFKNRRPERGPKEE